MNYLVKTYSKNIQGLLLLLISVFLLLPSTAVAQSTKQSAQQSLQVEGLDINPFLIEIDATPGSTITRSIKLRNTTNEPLTYVASINDFITNGKTGQPLFLETDKDAEPKYSLSRWIAITKQPQFTIPPLGETEVEFTISPPADADPGTHYGGILFGRPPGKVDNSSSAVEHKAGAIILVKLGNSQEQIELDNFAIAKQNKFESGPVDFISSLSNVGNVHSKPKGEVTIHNFAGGQVAQLPINRDANIILPQSSRDFVTEWKPKLAFGYYIADAVIYYGNPKLELHNRITFWVIPIKETVLGGALILILIFLLWWVVRRYNRYIIRHAKGGD